MSRLGAKCRCGLKGLTGDGCQYCNPKLHIEHLEEEIRELKAQLNQPQQEPIGEVRHSLATGEPYIVWYEGSRIHDGAKLYTTPQIRLSDAEASSILAALGITPVVSPQTLIDAIMDAMIKESA